MEERIQNAGQLILVATICGAGLGALAGLVPVSAGAPIGWVPGGASLLGVGFLSISLNLFRTPSPKAMHQKDDVTTRISAYYDDGRSGSWVEFPVEKDRMVRLAQGLMAGKPMVEAKWLRVFTRAEFVDIRDEMIARGWARWRSATAPQRGVELTAKGRANLKALAALARGNVPLLPTEDGYTPL